MSRRLYQSAVLALILASGTASAQSWTKKASLPGSIRDASVSFTIGDRIYLGAGISTMDFYEYNTITGEWTRKADIPGTRRWRSFGAGFSIGQKGYIGFGDDSTILKKDLWEYDPASNTWTRKADFPGAARDGVTSFVIGSKAYIGGGFDGASILGDFYEYDPMADVWTKKEDMPTGPVIFQASFTIGDHAYVTTGGSRFAEIPETYRYNPTDDTWDQLADFPGLPRQAAVGFAVNGRGYIGLGQSGYTTVFNDFYSFDPVKNQWTAASSFPAGTGRGWSVASVVNGKAYMGTGFDLAGSFFNDWWEMNASAAGAQSPSSGEGDLRIHPNPARTSIEVTTPATEATGRITLLDCTGREVMTRELLRGGERMNLDISPLPAGVYLLRLQSGVSTRVEKIVKE